VVQLPTTSAADRLKDKVELNSLPPEDKRPLRSQMAMNNDHTVEQFKAREIEQEGPTTQERMAANAEAMATVQAQYLAMTVKGRKAQRDKLRKKLGLDVKPPPKRVRPDPQPRIAEEDLIEDKIYGIGKRSDKAQ
jgi:hypothetical protein